MNKSQKYMDAYLSYVVGIIHRLKNNLHKNIATQYCEEHNTVPIIRKNQLPNKVRCISYTLKTFMNLTAIVKEVTFNEQNLDTQHEYTKIFAVAENLVQDKDHSINYLNVVVLGTTTKWDETLMQESIDIMKDTE